MTESAIPSIKYKL